MAKFTVELSDRAAKQLHKLEPQARRRVEALLELLADEPRPPRATQLVGLPRAWRARTGDYRVIYKIDDGRLFVFVVEVGHRRQIYERR